MSPPTQAKEVPALLGNGVGAQNLERIPRKVVNDAVAVLLDLGYRATRNQALALLHEWREWRQRDTREFIAGEFRLFAQRRGDLLVVRGKRHHEWRVTT